MLRVATTTALVAGALAATAAYLEAEFHLSHDLGIIGRMKVGEAAYLKSVKEHRESCFYIFEDAVQKWPDNVSIWSRTGCYTAKEVYEKACQYAGWFLDHDVRPGQLVAFYLQNSPEFIFAWLGLWAIGCAPAMINFNLAGNALVHCLEVSGAKLVLVDEDKKCRGRVNDEKSRMETGLGMKITLFDGALRREITSKPATRPDDSYRDGVHGDFPAALFYTSGTTGMPKGAAFTTTRMHIGAIGYSTWGTFCNQTPGLGGDRWYNCMPYYHGTGGQSAMAQMMAGTSVAIGKGFSVRNFWKDVRDSQSTFIVYVGETARYLLAAPPDPLDKVHKVRTMYGNGLRPDVWLRFRERFGVEEVVEFFNSSEGMFALLNYNRGDYLANCVGQHGLLLRLAMNSRYIPVEVDHDSNELVRDPTTGFAKRKPYEEGGEIIVQIPSEAHFAGYWGDSAATKKKFAHDVFKKGDVFYRSGDALRRTSDGRWYFLDRLGDTYRWKSENVSTAEVAQTIGHFPGILEANVYGVRIPHHEGRAGCAALSVAPEQRAKFDWQSFAKYALDRLPRYAVPVFVRVMSGDVGSGAMHNNKQNKVGLKEEGVDPKKMGTKVVGGEADTIFYMKSSSGTFVRFERADWDALVGGRARL